MAASRMHEPSRNHTPAASTTPARVNTAEQSGFATSARHRDAASDGVGGGGNGSAKCGSPTGTLSTQCSHRMYHQHQTERPGSGQSNESQAMPTDLSPLGGVGQLGLGVVASLLAMVIAFSIRQLASLRSEYSGLWLAEVLDQQGNPSKADIYWSRYRRRSGEIRSKYERRWSATGADTLSGVAISVLHGDCIVAAYWSPDRTVDNRGCSIVWKDDTRKQVPLANTCFQGFYWHRQGTRVVKGVVRFTRLPRTGLWKTWRTWHTYKYTPTRSLAHPASMDHERG